MNFKIIASKRKLSDISFNVLSTTPELASEIGTFIDEIYEDSFKKAISEGSEFPVFIEHKNFQHAALARNKSGKIISCLTMKPYENPNEFYISLLTHPDYQNMKLSSVLVIKAIQLAKGNKQEIFKLKASVNNGSYSEKIFTKLGFNTSNPKSSKVVYELDF